MAEDAERQLKRFKTAWWGGFSVPIATGLVAFLFGWSHASSGEIHEVKDLGQDIILSWFLIILSCMCLILSIRFTGNRIRKVLSQIERKGTEAMSTTGSSGRYSSLYVALMMGTFFAYSPSIYGLLVVGLSLAVPGFEYILLTGYLLIASSATVMILQRRQIKKTLVSILREKRKKSLQR